jgi:hypothetical protein
MFFKVLSLVIVALLMYIAYIRFPAAPARISQPVASYDNQFEVFRDMEPSDQTRENPWIGFLQEDVRKNRTGPIGDFTGYEDPSIKAPLYMVQ